MAAIPDEPLTESLAPPALESEHVHSVYDSIAPHFSHTRHHPWPLVTAFLADVAPSALVADVGCGNGKYLGGSPHVCMIGSDRSLPLLQTCAQSGKNYNLFGCDALKVPLRTGAFDAAISIAVLHHISTRARRIALISELARIVKVGGRVFIVAWAFEQDERSKRQFDEQDVMVEWKLQNKYVAEPLAAHAKQDADKKWVVYQRYCHVYTEGELEELVACVPGLKVVETQYSRSNWCVTVERVAE
uniref:Methyltransferase type 11 domain-containing protein n=1 Tax=Globisporangium ultimum (strain ATCC 200006 / CBS 805.95 / DAOM BR144) TaxID=431595 RepID=K3W7F8_GLOUD